MRKNIDKREISFGTRTDFDNQDKEYWAKASVEEKLKTITYLRECFYGAEATTGRLQRVYQFIKLE